MRKPFSMTSKVNNNHLEIIVMNLVVVLGTKLAVRSKTFQEAAFNFRLKLFQFMIVNYLSMKNISAQLKQYEECTHYKYWTLMNNRQKL